MSVERPGQKGEGFVREANAPWTVDWTEQWLKHRYPEYNELKKRQATRWENMGFWDRVRTTVWGDDFQKEDRKCLESEGYYKLDTAQVHKEVQAFINANIGPN